MCDAVPDTRPHSRTADRVRMEQSGFRPEEEANNWLAVVHRRFGTSGRTGWSDRMRRGSEDKRK
jgi:hypothetical protein